MKARIYFPDGTRRVEPSIDSTAMVAMLRELVPNSSIMGFSGTKQWYMKLFFSGPIINSSTVLTEMYHLDGIVILFTNFGE